jgi:hypothetical protein
MTTQKPTTDAASLIALAISRALGGGFPTTVLLDDGGTVLEIDSVSIVGTDAGSVAQLTVASVGELYRIEIQKVTT